MTLHETRVSEIQPGDLWLLDGGWVVVNAIEVGHPDDRVGIDYIDDGVETEFTNPWGFEVAVVKREGETQLSLAARGMVESYDSNDRLGDWADKLHGSIEYLRETLQ